MLEAVFIFSSGKSFKSSNLQSLIKYEKENFYLKGFDNKKGYIVEVEKHKNKPISIKQSAALLADSTVLKFFFAIVAYVALEQGVANSISVFLQRYHQIDPSVQGAQVVSQFWLALTFGCLLGIVLLKLFDAKTVLLGFSIGAGLSLLSALFGSLTIALIAFPLVGFFLSIMWSVIFSLALNSVSQNYGAVSGILCTGIVGGAFASPTVGALSELIDSLQVSMLILLVPLGYIFSVGIWATPLVKNHTFSFMRKASSNKELQQHTN